MKRALISLAGILAVGSGAFGSAPAATTAPTASAASHDPCLSKPSKFERQKCEDFAHSAPADEYFGRMKMSFLGINNTFHDETIRAGDYTTDSGIINKVDFADEALADWAKRYPGDPQLARSYYLAIVMFKKVYVQAYQEKAWAYMHVLATHFSTTYFGKLEKAAIAQGFTEHYFGTPQMCPPPLPSGAVAMTAPETSPSPTPTPAPGKPMIELIDPPCVQPSPAPTLTPQ